MKIADRAKLEKYKFDRQVWGPGGGHKLESVTEWENRLTLLLEGVPCEATIDPGSPKVDWGPILGLRLGHIWPFVEEVPVVRMHGYAGITDRAIQTFTGFRPIEDS